MRHSVLLQLTDGLHLQMCRFSTFRHITIYCYVYWLDSFVSFYRNIWPTYGSLVSWYDKFKSSQPISFVYVSNVLYGWSGMRWRLHQLPLDYHASPCSYILVCVNCSPNCLEISPLQYICIPMWNPKNLSQKFLSLWHRKINASQKFTHKPLLISFHENLIQRLTLRPL